MSNVTIKTNRGTMVFELYDTETPVTANNFIKLVKEGFYDGLTFHRVIPDFVLQGGCPDGNGAGGPGYKIDCETNAEKQHHERGVLSMAHAGKNTGGSQFFVVINRDSTAHLDGVHTCFGKLISGDEVIDLIQPGDTMEKLEIG